MQAELNLNFLNITFIEALKNQLVFNSTKTFLKNFQAGTYYICINIFG